MTNLNASTLRDNRTALAEDGARATLQRILDANGKLTRTLR